MLIPDKIRVNIMDSQPTDQNSQPAQAPPAEPAKPLERMPGQWPGAFGLYKYSKQAVMLNLGTLVIFWLIGIAVSIVTYKLGIVGNLINFVVGAFAAAGYVATFIAGVRGEKVEFGAAANRALSLTLNMLLLTLLMTVVLAASLIALIIPFFFVLPRISLAEYFLVDKKMGVMDAFKASWNSTKGHSMKVWGIYGVNLLFALLCVTIIGIPFAIYFLIMYSAALAILYELINKNPAPQPAAAAPAQKEPATNPEPSQSDQPPAA